MGHLAETLLDMLQKRLSGIYHVFAPVSLSKYEFGVRLAREFDLDANLIRPISALDSDLPTAFTEPEHEHRKMCKPRSASPCQIRRKDCERCMLTLILACAGNCYPFITNRRTHGT